jgi:cytidine deaminase
MGSAKTRIPRLNAAERELVDAALAAMKRAYAPYSKFSVGAALLAANGSIHPGCNLENASFGATVCAERNAVAHAVVAGSRQFTTLAVATRTSPPTAPCGICRQVLREFAPKLVILLVNPQGELTRTRLDKLLPMGFSAEQL